MEEYITIQKDEVAEITEKKSKFIANLYYIQDVQDAETKIKEIRKKYHDARHNCIAYRIITKEGVIEKSSDDGEPSGTAGMPMLNILQKNNLCNILIVVTRYFGGILLGTGGLVRAYSDATIKAIENAEKIQNVFGIQMKVKLDYSEYEKFKYYCKKNGINIQNVVYNEKIFCDITLDLESEQKLISDFETKKINIEELKEFDKKFIEKSIIN